MPILVTQELINATKPAETGWSLVEVKEVKKSPAKDPSFVDRRVVLTCLAGPKDTNVNVGRTVTFGIFGKPLDMMISEAISRAIGFVCAAMNTTQEELFGADLEQLIDTTVGMKLWVEIKDRPDPKSGQIYKDCTAFSPDSVVPF